MSWRLVEGVPLPDAVGGHPALDFCNTRAGWGDPLAKEYLTGPDVLALWARVNGLVEPSVQPARETGAGHAAAAGDNPERTALAQAVALREALYACALRRGTPADWDLVSARGRRGAQSRPARAGRGRRAGRLAGASRDGPGDRRARRRRGRCGGPADLVPRGVRRRLPRRGLRLAVRRPAPQTALVLHGRMRQPGQGAPVRRAPAGERRGLGRPCPRAHIGRENARGVTQRPPPDDDWLYPERPERTGHASFDRHEFSPELLRVSRPRRGQSVYVRS